MKNLFRYFFLVLVIPVITFTSCKDDGDGDVDMNHFTLMKDYMLENNLDLPDIIGSKTTSPKTFFVTAAPATEAEVPAWTAGFDAIFDIRGEDDYNAGHIDATNIKNVAWGDILSEAQELGQSAKILLVCFSGQSACYATSLLRLAGYSNAKALKWGMSGWNSTCANHEKGWNNATGNDAANGHAANWSTGPAPNNEVSNYPSISSTATNGQTVLMERVEAVFNAGFKGVAGTTVLGDPTSYHINNYFSEPHYSGFGRIDGAFRINPLTVKDDQIKYLDADPTATVVTYCYTGQTSAIITAYLNVLGYKAISLKSGINSIYNDHPFWTAGDGVPNKWGGDSNPKEYTTVPTAGN